MSGGAGGREVGRISIRVVPDLDEFRSKVAAAAKGIPDAKVHVDSDATEAREKIVAETRDLPDAKVKVDVDESSIDRMRRKLGELNLAFERRMKSSLGQKDLIPDAQKEMERRLGRMDLGWDKKIADLKRAPLTALEEKFKLKPALDEAGIEEMRLRLSHENFTAKVKLETDRANLERMARGIESEFDKTLDKIFTGNGRRGIFGRMADSFGDSLSSTGSGVGGAGLKGMAQFTPNIGGFGGGASIAIIVAAASLLAPALAMFAQVAVSLPAMLTAIAAPLGVFVLGIGGIKKALEDVGLAGTDKKGKLKVGEVIKKIQQPIEDTFEKGFKPIFQSLVDAASQSPVFTSGLQFIAQGIVNFSSGIASALTSAPNLDMLNRLTNSIGSMLNNMTPGITSFANAMIRLTTDVGDHLPGLGNWLTGLGDRFSNWVATVDKPKKDWWGKDIPGSSTLDGAVTNMKPILNSIIDFVGKLTDAGLKLAADPNMANNIKTVIDGLTNFILNVLPQLNTVFDKMAKIFGGITPPVPKPEDLPKGPDGKPLPESLPKGPDGQPFAPAPPGAPQYAGVPKGYAPGPPSKAERDSADQWHRDWDNTYAFAQNPVPWIGRWFGRTFTRPHSDHPVIMEQGGGGDQPKPELPKPQGPGFPPGLLGMLTGVPQPGAPAAPGVGAGAGVQQAQAAAQQAQASAQGVKAAFDGLPGALAGVWQAITAGAKGAFDGLVQAAQAACKSIIDEVSKLPAAITAALSGLRAAGEAAGKSLGEGLAAGIAAGKDQAVTAARDLASAVNEAGKTNFQINSPSKVWHGYGSGLGEGLGDGIDAGSGDAVSRAQALAKQINDAMQGGVSGVNAKEVNQQIKQSMAELDVQRDQLQAQRDALPRGKDSKGARDDLSGQLQRVKQARDALSLERDQLKLGGMDGKGSDSMSEAAQMITKGLAQVLDAAKAGVMANVQQFESDIGISGKGAIPTIANFGIGWAQKEANNMINSAFGIANKGPKQGQGANDVHFHVNSVDEALQADQTIKNRQALQWKGR